MGNEQALLYERDARVTVDAFLALDASGAFQETGRVELIEGRVIEVGPTSYAHGRVLAELATGVGLIVRDREQLGEALLRVSARLTDDSLPDVDLVIAAPSNEDFVTPATARLFVEVAEGTLDLDSGSKQRLYARAGVPEYWLVDVGSRTIIRLHEPVGEVYRQRAEFAFGAAVPSAMLDDLTVDTARLG